MLDKLVGSSATGAAELPRDVLLFPGYIFIAIVGISMLFVILLILSVINYIAGVKSDMKVVECECNSIEYNKFKTLTKDDNSVDNKSKEYAVRIKVCDEQSKKWLLKSDDYFSKAFKFVAIPFVTVIIILIILLHIVNANYNSQIDDYERDQMIQQQRYEQLMNDFESGDYSDFNID